eukprot:5699987-Prymnesium_polylepis.1
MQSVSVEPPAPTDDEMADPEKVRTSPIPNSRPAWRASCVLRHHSPPLWTLRHPALSPPARPHVADPTRALGGAAPPPPLPSRLACSDGRLPARPFRRAGGGVYDHDGRLLGAPEPAARAPRRDGRGEPAARAAAVGGGADQAVARGHGRVAAGGDGVLLRAGGGVGHAADAFGGGHRVHGARGRA